MTPRPLQQLFDATFHGKYRFDEFLELNARENCSRVVWNGRTVYKASRKLRDFHRFISMFVLDYLPVSERSSFAYRKGSTVTQAVLPHARSRAFFQTDIVHFFECISADLVRSTR